MAIQYFDLGNSLAKGIGAAAMANEVQQRNALAGVYKQYGQGIANGDQEALNALAAVDPMSAMSVRNSMAANDRAAQQHQFATNRENRAAQTFEMEVARHAETLSAAERAAEAEAIKRGVFSASAARTPQEWDQIVTSLGQKDLVGQFANREALLRQYMTAAQILESGKPQSAPGKVYADIQSGKLPEGTPLQSSGVTINTGDPVDPRPMADKPPKGYQRRYDEARGSWVDEPIPGSEVATDAQKGETAAQVAAAAYERKFDLVDSKLTDAISLLDEKGRWVAGYGSNLSRVPESSARDFQSILDTIKANLGFEELQSMRDSSPTGGALGQVSEREIAFLQAMQGNLDAAQSPDQLRKVLVQIQEGRRKFSEERKRALSGESDYSPASIMSMSERDIVNVPIEEMGLEQLDALEARWAQIKGGK